MVSIESTDTTTMTHGWTLGLKVATTADVVGVYSGSAEITLGASGSFTSSDAYKTGTSDSKTTRKAVAFDYTLRCPASITTDSMW